jgi:hypothetical protein
MSELALGRDGATASPGTDARRVLQMIGGTAAGNPGIIARPISWNATLVADHLVLLNTVFATIQLLLGLGIAYRPTVRPALAASIVLAVALIAIAAGVFLPLPLARSALILALVVAAFIWVFGEAFGQILAGGATDPNSAPLLALLVLACWPLARPEEKSA